MLRLGWIPRWPQFVDLTNGIGKLEREMLHRTIHLIQQIVNVQMKRIIKDIQIGDSGGVWMHRLQHRLQLRQSAIRCHTKSISMRVSSSTILRAPRSPVSAMSRAPTDTTALRPWRASLAPRPTRAVSSRTAARRSSLSQSASRCRPTSISMRVSSSRILRAPRSTPSAMSCATTDTKAMRPWHATTAPRPARAVSPRTAASTTAGGGVTTQTAGGGPCQSRRRNQATLLCRVR
jgi:hypothetical protein